MKLAAIILAGGASSRMGTPKALLMMEGESFAARLAGFFREAGASPVLLVLGYEHEAIAAAISGTVAAQVVVNPAPEYGQLSSLQVGLRALPAGWEGAAFCPVDIPIGDALTIRRLCEGFAARADEFPLAAPRCQGKRGHPVCVAARLFAEFLSLPPTAQARDVIRRHEREIYYVDVDDPGILRDVDTPEEYRRLPGRSHL